MPDSTSPGPAARVLVSDFDGTMTRHDFYSLAIEKLIPADTPNYWTEYRAGRLTHFEALRRYFAAIDSTEQDVLEVVRQMEFDPEIPRRLESLQAAGWQVVVTSAGCEWYIRHHFAAAGIDIPVYSNPGRFDEQHGLMMELPGQSPYFSASVGVDKQAVVQSYIRQGARVAFAGDGYPDADAARLVPADLRFARADLADVLRQENRSFRPFEKWTDISRMLLESQG